MRPAVVPVTDGDGLSVHFSRETQSPAVKGIEVLELIPNCICGFYDAPDSSIGPDCDGACDAGDDLNGPDCNACNTVDSVGGSLCAP